LRLTEHPGEKYPGEFHPWGPDKDNLAPSMGIDPAKVMVSGVSGGATMST